MLVVLALAVPIGVAAAIYLEEFAPRNRWTDIIEVNISNLAAVPSIVFGILGLAAFINFAGLPQSAPIVGGLVLVLMTLPRIIIPARAALKAVPPSIRDAALGVGASKMQSVFHHVLPLATPGILTGVILGMAQALGETAPLLLIGMVAFVKNFPAAPPEGLFDPASALPVQVYNWTQRADRIVKIEERRVSLDALERALCADVQVSEARVLVLPGAREQLAAVVVPADPALLGADEAGRRAFFQRLGMVLAQGHDAVTRPRRWRLAAALPANAQGKTTQTALAALFQPLMPAAQWLQRGETAASLQLPLDPALRSCAHRVARWSSSERALCARWDHPAESPARALPRE